MAIDFGGSGTTGPTAGTITVEIPDTGGNNLLMVCARDQSGTASLTATISELGENMTLKKELVVSSIAHQSVFFYTGLPPATYNVVINNIGARGVIGYDVRFNVDQDNSFGNEGTAAGGTVTLASEPGNVVIDFITSSVGNLAPNLVADSDQVMVVQNTDGVCGAGVSCPSLGISYEEGAASVDMGWTGLADSVAHYAVELRPATPVQQPLIRYLHDPVLGKLTDLSTARDIDASQLATDEFIYAPEPFIPTARQASDNIKDLAVSFVEQRTDREEETQVKGSQETFLEFLLGDLAGSGA
jgi:hypothetical protein